MLCGGCAGRLSKRKGEMAQDSFLQSRMFVETEEECVEEEERERQTDVWILNL